MTKIDNNIVCPVCGKVGIQDYHHEDVVCPCCGTDLSIYRLLHDVKNTPQPVNATDSKIWKVTTAALVAVVLAGASYCMLSEKSTFEMPVSNSSELSALRDSISNLKKELENAKTIIPGNNVRSKDPGDTLYVVRKNDSPCKISRKLYKTERRYKEIEAVMKKPLEPGDILKLKK